MLGAWQAVRSGQRKSLLLAGVLLGLLIYCRSAFVLWIPGLLLAFPFLLRFNWRGKKWSWRQAAVWTAMFAAVVCATQLPWWFRNAAVLNSFQILGTKGPTTLLGGYCDESLVYSGEWRGEPEVQLRQRFLSPTNSAETAVWIEHEKLIASQAQAQVMNWSREHWQLMPSLALKRVVTEWNPYVRKSLLFKLLACIGVWYLWRRNRVIFVWLLLPLGLNTLLAMTTYSLGGRYLVPSYGAFYILVATGSWCLCEGALELLRNARSRLVLPKVQENGS